VEASNVLNDGERRGETDIGRPRECIATSYLFWHWQSADNVMAISVPEGHVALILLQVGASSFYLQIPLNIIDSLCLKPRKYLLFLGWCILGVEGVLARKRHGNEIPLNGNLINQGIYHYVAASPGMFSLTTSLLSCA